MDGDYCISGFLEVEKLLYGGLNFAGDCVRGFRGDVVMVLEGEVQDELYSDDADEGLSVLSNQGHQGLEVVHGNLIGVEVGLG